jgi:hypothetical protein
MKNNDQDESLAAIFLWNEAHKLVMALDHMAQKRPELFRLIARQTFYWPGFISRKRRSTGKMPSSWTRLS